MPFIIFGIAGLSIAGLSIVKDIVTDNTIDETVSTASSNAVALIIAGTAAWLIIQGKVKFN